ncbi:MAG: 16S rRNA (adenine(1518)-N(6)/adenine(1519)-N(6))-dimethyltransferase RsmA [Hyphomicrobiales bacterium]
MVKPKKHLGQHFLTDRNIAIRIVDQLSEDCKDIIEVGAGTGVLTQYLMNREKQNLHIIEIDEESVDYLKATWPHIESSIIPKDFLKYPLENISTEPMAIIGNFPYNISSQIFFKVLDYKDSVPEVVGMIQKEVAERIAAGPGSKTYGILSVLLQAWYDIEYCFTVHEDVFNPPPKVKSAVIRLVRNNVKSLDCNEKLFKRIIKQGFNQRRKTLRNSLKSIFVDKELMQNELFSKRPEQLGVQEFVEITKYAESIM